MRTIEIDVTDHVQGLIDRGFCIDGVPEDATITKAVFRSTIPTSSVVRVRPDDWDDFEGWRPYNEGEAKE